eukprot:TRINITY_DN3174_c0_g3_i1.p1 TRINITY_DN3174_c0_g3~~TRINITY_DN3174_c0_g3_i1.p1  ORF type:complete len:1060 (+),score=320.13 TRINITY_DN3174_c0_g3_i1:85-3264(+)
MAAPKGSKLKSFVAKAAISPSSPQPGDGGVRSRRSLHKLALSVSPTSEPQDTILLSPTSDDPSRLSGLSGAASMGKSPRAGPNVANLVRSAVAQAGPPKSPNSFAAAANALRQMSSFRAAGAPTGSFFSPKGQRPDLPIPMTPSMRSPGAFFSPKQTPVSEMMSPAAASRGKGAMSSTLLAVARARMLAGRGGGAGSPTQEDTDGLPRIMSRIAAYRQGLVGANELKPQQAKDQAKLERNLRQLEKQREDALHEVDDAPSAEQQRKAEIMAKARRVLRAIARAGMFAKSSGKPAAVLGGPSKRPAPLHLLKQQAAGEQHLASLWSVMERGRDGRMALPTARDLQDLPPNLRKTFTDLANETLKKFMYPRVLLWRRRIERSRMMHHAKDTCPPMTIDILRKQAMFKSWPQPLLDELIQAVVLMCFEKDEFIIHEGEQAGSGIYFLMAGAVEVLKKKDRRDKRIGGSNAMTLARNLQPVICVGEFSFLTEEPRMASIRATMRCDCMVLKKDDFNRFVKELPVSVFEQVVEVAFGTRNKNMHLSYPMEEEVLQGCSIFRPCPSTMLRMLLDKLRPYAVPKNMTVARADANPADRMLFLRHGKCGVMRQIMAQSRGVVEDAYVHTLRAPCVIGDTALLHGAPNNDTIRTLSTCDFWVLWKKDFDNVLRHHERVVHLMMAEARLQRQGQLGNQQNLFRECVYDIPILKDVATRQQMRHLVKIFVARVYKPLSIICSMANSADRLIILYRGRIRVSDSFRRDLPSRPWHRGECAGFTCIVPHRWARMAVSREIVECLELPRSKYSDFLQEHGVLQKAQLWAKALMFPLAFPYEDAKRAADIVSGLRMPRMYPQSESTVVDLTERGFCDAHLEYLTEKAGGTNTLQLKSMSTVPTTPPTGPASPPQPTAPRSPGVSPPDSPLSPATLQRNRVRSPPLRGAEPQQQQPVRAATVEGLGGRRPLRLGKGPARWQRVSSYLWLSGAERVRRHKMPQVVTSFSIGDGDGGSAARLDPRQSALVLSLRKVGKERRCFGGAVRVDHSDNESHFQRGLSGDLSAADVLAGKAG